MTNDEIFGRYFDFRSIQSIDNIVLFLVDDVLFDLQ
jgi:hypothetical protein